jgi:Fur family transcriptional regulator, ferric uptake regulator
MGEGTQSRWAEHAISALRRAGFRSGGARRRVVELLGEEGCALSALEIDRRLQKVGRASVYRTLEQLEGLGLIRRLEMGGTACYERIEPGGEHHHHMVCERCHAVIPFEDERLERVIHAISGSSAAFDVSEHEVVLRGTCSRCERGASNKEIDAGEKRE